MKNGSYPLLGHTIIFGGSSWTVVRDGENEIAVRPPSFQSAVMWVLEQVATKDGTRITLTKSQLDQAFSCIKQQVVQAYGIE